MELLPGFGFRHDFPETHDFFKRSSKSKFTEMTPRTILERCRHYGLYDSPHLNDVLFLHMCGFERISNLTEYINVKTLWLQENAISRIENLEPCKYLTSLFVYICIC